jgi:hypothetical protein
VTSTFVDPAAAHRKTKKNRRKAAAIIGGVTAVVVGGTAWAAVTLFGFGTADVAATSSQNLTVDGVVATSALVPGGTAGAKGVVHNPNNFPVKVTAVIIYSDGLHGQGVGCDEATLTPKGVYGSYGPDSKPGFKTVLTPPVTVAGNGGAEWVEIPQAVSQAAAATKFCGFKANVGVEALAGN